MAVICGCLGRAAVWGGCLQLLRLFWWLLQLLWVAVEEMRLFGAVWGSFCGWLLRKCGLFWAAICHTILILQVGSVQHTYSYRVHCLSRSRQCQDTIMHCPTDRYALLSVTGLTGSHCTTMQFNACTTRPDTFSSSSDNHRVRP